MKCVALSFLALAAMLTLSCHGKETPAEAPKEEVLSEIPKDFKVPVKIWEALAKVPEGTKKSEKPEKEGEGGGDTGDAYIFSELKIELKEKNPGVIKDGEAHIRLPRGGGEVDLANYVTGNPGSYYVKIEFPEFEGATIKKIIFISRARKRKIDDQVFGSGCREFFDISTRFFKEMTKEGLKVNTTRRRDVSVLSGSFILMAKKGTQSYITQVSFTDSGNKNLLCPETERRAHAEPDS